VAGREDHHFVTDVDAIADENLGSEIEREPHVDRALITDVQATVDLTAAANLRRAHEGAACSNIEARQTEHMGSRATQGEVGQHGERCIHRKQPWAKPTQLVEQRLTYGPLGTPAVGRFEIGGRFIRR
jgi:hypothetical protein